MVFFFFFLPLFVLFILCGLLSEVWRFGLFRCEGCCSQLALTSSGSLPVHFRVLLLLCWWCWFLFPFIRPSFFSFLFIISLQVACPFCGLPGLGFGVGLVTVSRLTLCLFVCSMLCCVLFRWLRGARVSCGLSSVLGWIVCVSCPVAVAIV